MEKLTEYTKKRNPARTPEPFDNGNAAKARKKGERLKFAVQLHAARRIHYDFRLEWDGVLLSWAVPKGPSYNPKDKRLAVRVEDHPLDYAYFEGVIPKGEYGGGTVMLWDEGEWEAYDDVEDGLQNGSLKLTLFGHRLRGKWTLVRMDKKEGEDEKNWLLIKERDELAKPGDGIAEYKTGVLSGRTMREIATEESLMQKRNPYDKVSVMLAKPLESVPEDESLLYEIKFDGYRIVAFCEGGEARLITRNGLDYTKKYPSVAKSLKEMSKGRAIVLDGEMIVADESGKSDFHALQNYGKSPHGKTLAYMAFDLLALDGDDLRERPLAERKSLLEKLLSGAPENVAYSRHIVGKGGAFFREVSRLGLEGVVGKRAQSPYRGGRNGDWIKVKCRPRQEFVIGGYSRTQKKARGVSALLLGVYDGDKLIHIGRVGSGFGEKESVAIEKILKRYASNENPFSAKIRAAKNEEIFWLQPEAVAEVEYAELIDGHILRQASFKGLREDKSAREVVMEGEKNVDNRQKKNESASKARPKPREDKEKSGDEVRGVKITNPDKVIYSKPSRVTKLEVIEYYDKVARRMMAFAGDRILSVVRCHKGVTGDCFFKKHPASEGDGVEVVSVTEKEGGEAQYFCLRDERGLISQAQLGTLEFHVWGSRAENIDKPDMMVFDLDPDEGMDLTTVRQGVKDLKSVLDSLSLKSFLKTSGGKGYHIVVPFLPTVGWTEFHDFARGVAKLMESKWPDRYTANVRKNKRGGKIFIDWIRNGKGATSVAPYSLRARPGAKVSMPISWRELSSVAPDGTDMTEALARLSRPDPWKDYFEVSQSLIKL